MEPQQLQRLYSAEVVLANACYYSYALTISYSTDYILITCMSLEKQKIFAIRTVVRAEC